MQREIFDVHFDVAKRYERPMYFISNKAEDDFVSMVKKKRDYFTDGVISSFTGTESELKKYLDLGLYIGISG